MQSLFSLRGVCASPAITSHLPSFLILVSFVGPLEGASDPEGMIEASGMFSVWESGVPYWDLTAQSLAEEGNTRLEKNRTRNSKPTHKKSHQKFKTDPRKIAPEIQNRPTKNRTRNSKPTHKKSHQKFKTDPQKIAPEIQNRPTKKYQKSILERWKKSLGKWLKINCGATPRNRAPGPSQSSFRAYKYTTIFTAYLDFLKVFEVL